MKMTFLDSFLFRIKKKCLSGAELLLPSIQVFIYYFYISDSLAQLRITAEAWKCGCNLVEPRAIMLHRIRQWRWKSWSGRSTSNNLRLNYTHQKLSSSSFARTEKATQQKIIFWGCNSREEDSAKDEDDKKEGKEIFSTAAQVALTDDGHRMTALLSS